VASPAEENLPIYNGTHIIYFCSRCPQLPCCVGTSNQVWFCGQYACSHECNSATMGGCSTKLPLVTVPQFHTTDTYLWLSVWENNFFLTLLFSIECKHRVDAYNSWWFLKLNLTSCAVALNIVTLFNYTVGEVWTNSFLMFNLGLVTDKQLAVAVLVMTSPGNAKSVEFGIV
jgi:hypothetical protein